MLRTKKPVQNTVLIYSNDNVDLQTARLGSGILFDKQMAETMVSVSVEYIKTMMSNAALGKMVSPAQVVCSELEDVKKLGVEAQEKKARVEQVRSLLSQLSKIAYAAEDVIDTYVSETGSFMARRLLNYPHAQQASKKMRSLHTQVQEVKERLHRCNSEGSSSSPKRGRVRLKRSNTAKGHVQASDDSVVGIAEEVERLVKELVSRDGGEMDVLGIVGMGGSGKTTLARILYNHNKVQKHFKHRVWVTPRRVWDATCVEPEISTHIGQSKDVHPFHNNDNSEEEDESAELQQLISTNTCLLVLDDVWDWDSLEQILPKSIVNNITNTKSKIIFTSRHHLQPPSESPSTLLKWHLHQTQLLNEDNSWRLFSTVFTSNSGKEPGREHRSLAKEMLIKCEGLPLAIVTLATFLKTKKTIHEWEKVYSQLVGKQGPSLYKSVNDILALSYDGLPDYLKPLFLYIGLFRQGPTISAGVLKRLWIAEGFVGPQCRPEETLEKAANRLLQQLIDCTMVQVVKRNYAGKPKTLRIHDIMRDLCITKAKELVFLTVSSSDSSQMSTTNDSRRAAVNLSKRSSLPINSSHLRSLLLYGPVDDNDRHARIGKQQANLDLDLVCDKFKLLRVLDIKGIKTSDGSMPKEIGSLIHLRYLGIRSTNIQELPKSIGKLRELLTLDYWNVSADHRGITLPNVLWKLQNLRNLYLPQEIRNSKETFKFETMKELQTLWGVRGGNWMLKEMPSLGYNLQKLSIQGISKPKHLKSLFESPVIRTYDNLYSLALDWYDIELDSDGLTTLCEINKLRKLRLTGKVARSVTLKFPSNLGKLELFFTQIWGQDNMEALGTLANLKFLRLAKDSYMEIEWVISRENAFPKLEELKLSNLRNLKKWDMKTEKGIIMPSLKKLSIVSCIALEGLPEGLKHINGLEILNIKGMPTNFIAKLRKEKNSGVNARPGGEDFHIVQNIRNIVIQKSYMPLFS